jgi:N-methylhydantoinase A
MKLNRQSAFSSIKDLGSKIGLNPVECAAGICRIVEMHMADVIRKVTVEKGYDPRDFVLFAFGGAGPAHAGVFARELGVRKIVIPQRKAASTWCAFGAAAADVLHIFEHSEIMATPVPAKRINEALENLERQAKALMAREGIAEKRQRFEFSLDVRHRGQINEVEVLLPFERLPNNYEPRLRSMFTGRYEKLYGRGSALAGAQLEIVVARLRARALTPRPRLMRSTKNSITVPAAAKRPARSIYWPDLGKFRSTPVFDGELASGNRIAVRHRRYRRHDRRCTRAAPSCARELRDHLPLNLLIGFVRWRKLFADVRELTFDGVVTQKATVGSGGRRIPSNSRREGLWSK